MLIVWMIYSPLTIHTSFLLVTIYNVSLKDVKYSENKAKIAKIYFRYSIHCLHPVYVTSLDLYLFIQCIAVKWRTIPRTNESHNFFIQSLQHFFTFYKVFYQLFGICLKAPCINYEIKSKLE